MSVVDARAMSPTQRVLAMEELWASMCEHEDEVESPAWHGEVLAERRATLAAGETELVPLGELRERSKR